MNDDLPPAQFNVTLRRDVADEILRRLAYDSEFYDDFEANPAGAIRRANLEVRDDLRLPARVDLPSAEDIKYFLEKGCFPCPPPDPVRPYNGGCLGSATVYVLGSQTEIGGDEAAGS
jgi:hypothetical protein